MKNIIYVFIWFILLLVFAKAQNIGGGGEANPDLKTNLQSLKNWQDMKYGLFIHWGPVSLRGTEIGWSRGRDVPIEEYDNLYKEFNPVLFDAEKWVKMVKSAGMKYIIITSKHHDGFCIWDSEYTDYDIMSTPFKRDILKELSDACKRHGILFGTYHSICDWHHPDYTTRYGGDSRPVDESTMDSYVVYMKNQIKELVTKYDTKILWFDGEWEGSWNHNMGMDLYKYVRELGDDILINNRVDKGRAGMQGMTTARSFAGDFGTPEQEIGNFHPDIPWESCITICRQWAWKPNDQMKSIKECIQTLAQTAGGGGNLLLNVGPMLDGRIEQRQIDRLLEVGAWLNKNGESIYDTKGGPYKSTSWMSSTYKDQKIFLHLFRWPEKELILSELPGSNLISVKFINGKSLSFTEKDSKIVIQLPEKPLDENDTVIELVMDKSAEMYAPLEVPDNVLTGIQGSKLRFKQGYSNKYGARGEESLIDGIRGSRNYQDGKWVGFEEVDCEVAIDFGQVKEINKIALGCLQNQNSWIFFPKSVEFQVSLDGESYQTVGKVKIDSDQKTDGIEIRDVSIEIKSTDAILLKIKAENVKTCPAWHKGKGGKAWLFVDEIIIE